LNEALSDDFKQAYDDGDVSPCMLPNLAERGVHNPLVSHDPPNQAQTSTTICGMHSIAAMMQYRE